MSQTRVHPADPTRLGIRAGTTYTCRRRRQLSRSCYARRTRRLIGDAIVRRALTEWTNPDHAEHYLARQDTIPRRTEGEAVLLVHIPRSARRILDLGTGDGRSIALLRLDRPDIEALGLDISRPMLPAARQQLAGEDRITLLHHDMSSRLPDIGRFDAAVSCFAIHHLDDWRKRSLYGEVFALLEPGGTFANLEHVASPSERLHRRFYQAIGYPDDWEDPSNKLLDVETQLHWLRELGFEDVDCYWKWLEMALLIGVKPRERPSSAQADVDRTT